MISLEAALDAARKQLPRAERCEEYEDAYVFSEKGGGEPCVILKSSGEAVSMTYYCDTFHGEFVRMLRIEELRQEDGEIPGGRNGQERP